MLKRFVIFALLAALAAPAAAQQGVLKRTTLDVAEETSAIRLDGLQSVGVSVINSGTYTLAFEASADGGTTWVSVGLVDLSDFTRDTSTTAAGTWAFGNLGFSHFRVRASAYTSGAPVVSFSRGYGGVNAPLSAGSISGGNDAASATGAAVPSSASYTGVNIGGNLTGLTGFSLGSTRAGAFAIVDGSGNQITSFGGGTQYAVDAALGSTPTGTLAVAIRDDALSALTPVEGDAIGLRVDATGALWVIPSGTTTVSGTVTANLAAGTNNIGDVDVASIAAGDNNIGNVDIVSMPADATELPAAAPLADNTANPTVPGVGAYLMGFETTWDRLTSTSGSLNVNITGGAGSGGTAIADDGDFTAGTTSFTPVGGFYQSTVTACTDGDTCAAGITAGRAVKVALANADGSLVTYSQDVTEDAAASGGEAGPMVLTVRRDTAASSAGTDGDYATVNTDANGLLWTRTLDACSGTAKTHIPINISTATTTELTASLSGASNYYYICSIDIVTAGANNVALVDDDSDGCGSVTSGLAGGTTAGTGWNFAANGGLTKGNGEGTVFKTGGTNRVVCMVTSAAVQLSGSIQVVAAP